MEEQKQDDTDALEKPEESKPVESDVSQDTKSGKKVAKKRGAFFQRIIGHFNIYFLVFVLLVIVVSGVTIVSYNRQKDNLNPADVPSQQLDESAFSQIQSGDSSVGDAKQTLTIQSNAIFSGQVLARNDLEIAGTLKVGGALNLSGLVVSGDATFDQIQANDASIDGDTNIQGQLSVGAGLVVTSGGSFGGALSAPLISVEQLQISGDLQFTRHIDAGGATPTQANGPALGNGGTVSISGTDTAGSVSINTGGSASAGCFVTINFTSAFRSTPHVVITPVGSKASSIDYYITRTTTEFAICTTSSPPASSNFGFDYIVID